MLNLERTKKFNFLKKCVSIRTLDYSCFVAEVTFKIKELNFFKKTVVQNSFSRLYFLSPSSTFNHLVRLGIQHSSISSFHQRLWVYLRDKNTANLPSWLACFDNSRFNFFWWHVPKICNFGNRRWWCWIMWQRGLVSVDSCDLMGSFKMFLMISSFKKYCIFFEILFARVQYSYIYFIPFFCHPMPWSSQIVFFLFLKTSVLRLLFLRSSTSISNRWIVIAW